MPSDFSSSSSAPVRLAAFLRQFFHFEERQTSFTQEIRGGCVTFLTMSYILLVNPLVLSRWVGGDRPPTDELRDKKLLFVNNLSSSTAVVCGVGTLLLGILTRLPFACGPAMGMNGLLAGIVVLAHESQEQYDASRRLWNGMMASTLVAGLATFLLSLFRISPFLLRHLPDVIKNSIRVGVGLFQAFLALRSIEIIMPDERNLLKLVDTIDFSDRSEHGTMAQLLFLLTLLMTSALYVWHVDAAILISITLTTSICWVTRTGGVSVPRVPVQVPFFGETWWNVSFPDYIASPEVFASTISFVVITLFDVGGGMFAVSALMRKMMTSDAEASERRLLSEERARVSHCTSRPRSRRGSRLSDGKRCVSALNSDGMPVATGAAVSRPRGRGVGRRSSLEDHQMGESESEADADHMPLLQRSVQQAREDAICSIAGGGNHDTRVVSSARSDVEDGAGDRAAAVPSAPCTPETTPIATPGDALGSGREIDEEAEPRSHRGGPPRTPKTRALAERLLVSRRRRGSRFQKGDRHIHGGFAALVADYEHEAMALDDDDSYVDVPETVANAAAAFRRHCRSHRTPQKRPQRLSESRESAANDHLKVNASGASSFACSSSAPRGEDGGLNSPADDLRDRVPLRSRLSSFFLGFTDDEGDSLLHFPPHLEDGSVDNVSLSSGVLSGLIPTADDLLTPARARNTFLVIGLSTALGGALGNAPCTLYLECLAGVASGARTGFASVVAALLFFLSLPFAPVFRNVPPCAATPALLLIGSFMMSSFSSIAWSQYRSAIPAAVTIILMPFTASITPGIVAGLISYYFLTLVSEVNLFVRHRITLVQRRRRQSQYERAFQP